MQYFSSVYRHLYFHRQPIQKHYRKPTILLQDTFQKVQKSYLPVFEHLHYLLSLRLEQGLGIFTIRAQSFKVNDRDNLVIKLWVPLLLKVNDSLSFLEMIE